MMTDQQLQEMEMDFTDDDVSVRDYVAHGKTLIAEVRRLQQQAEGQPVLKTEWQRLVDERDGALAERDAARQEAAGERENARIAEGDYRQAKAEVTRLYDELGRVSEELGLPRSIGPASGWLKQQMSDLSEARRLLATRVEADRLSEGELRKDIAAVLAQEEEMRTHAVGDWIRFMYQGHLVIDEIAYLVPRASWDSTIQAVTVAHGQVPLDSVLETRPAAVLAQEEK